MSSGSRRRTAPALAAIAAMVLSGGCTTKVFAKLSVRGSSPVVSSAARTPLRNSALVVIEDAQLPEGELDELALGSATPGEQLIILGPNGMVLARSTVPSSADVSWPQLPSLGGPAASPHFADQLLSYENGFATSCLSGAAEPLMSSVPSGGTTYQHDTDETSLKTFASLLVTTCNEAKQERLVALRHWADSIDPSPVGASTSLATALAGGSDALATLGQSVALSSKVIVVFTTTLAGSPTPGSLDDDDVVVVSTNEPSIAQTTTAQVELLGAGAAQAHVLGPVDTQETLSGICRTGLSSHATPFTLGNVLFANDSAKLSPKAHAILEAIGLLFRRPGSSAVINGFASSTGSSQENLTISTEHAEAVAGWLDNQPGVDPAALVTVGHGATDLIAPGPSPLNRRVTVVVEQQG